MAAIQTIYNFLWGDIVRIPLPAQLTLSKKI